MARHNKPTDKTVEAPPPGSVLNPPSGESPPEDPHPGGANVTADSLEVVSQERDALTAGNAELQRQLEAAQGETKRATELAMQAGQALEKTKELATNQAAPTSAEFSTLKAQQEQLLEKIKGMPELERQIRILESDNNTLRSNMVTRDGADGPVIVQDLDSLKDGIKPMVSYRLPFEGVADDYSLVITHAGQGLMFVINERTGQFHSHEGYMVTPSKKDGKASIQISKSHGY